MNIIDVPKDCIRTKSGLFMNIFEPEVDMICIEDIAHALSAQPRFAGHLRRHYSIAQHSIHCSERVSQSNKLTALLHDASEAYMLDMPTPIKARMPEYKAYEHRLMEVIAEKFGFNYPYHPEIKVIDTVMVNFEWENLVKNNNKDFKCLTFLQAKTEFLRVFAELTT